MTATNALDAALMYAAAGLSPIPIKSDGSKAPSIPWSPYQTRIASRDEIRQIFRPGLGVAIVAGVASGNLEIIDIEAEAPFNEFHNLIHEHSPDLLDKLPHVETPSGGLHLFYRADEIEGNQKLAMRVGENGRPEVIFETRGRGGYVVTVGSPPACHPHNRVYKLVQGSLTEIPHVNAAERELLLNGARSFNRIPRRSEEGDRAHRHGNGDRPGDVLKERATWPEILEPHGWRAVGSHGDEMSWRRPGKEFGLSATTNYRGTDVLYVFSTNASPFEAETSYTKFAAFTKLNHAGDYSAAARAIALRFGMNGGRPRSSGDSIDDQEREASDKGSQDSNRARPNGNPAGSSADEYTAMGEAPDPSSSTGDARDPSTDSSKSDGSKPNGGGSGDSSTSDQAGKESDVERWPEPLAEAALYGLAGDIIRTIEPHTESDPAALLIQFLVSFGNAAGRNAYYQVEAARHYPNLYAVMVGATAKGRKGTAKNHIQSLFRSVDERWIQNCNQTGLSSGEGLIWAVRDPIEKKEPIKERSRVTDYQTVIEDHGVEDKRLLIIEAEFASTLRVMGRDGNTLSPVIRSAWDDGLLRSLTKNRPVQATGAHISIVGHITRDELRRYLDSTEAANGFANRFPWVCVRRSKCLPEGGHIPDENFKRILRKLEKALDFARRQAGRVQFDDEAREIWHGVYPKLSEGQPGLLGAVTGRAEAQVVRLALICALLNSSHAIRKPHLLAALAVWDYCDESAACIFGDSLGDPIADDILAALKRRPDVRMTRTEISDLFGRNRSTGQIGRALRLLFKLGLVKRQEVQTRGRSTEVWIAIQKAARP